jgi:two-component system, NtrC family, sensor kinase
LPAPLKQGILLKVPMNSQVTNKRLKGAGIYFIAEDLAPEPSWETFHFKYSGMRFPFFTFEPPVLVLQAREAHYPMIKNILAEIIELKMQTQVVLFDCHLSVPHLLEIFNTLKPYKILQSHHQLELEETLRLALETAHRLKQDKVLLELFNEQNRELKKISKDLEEKIEKRQKHLEENREKMFATNKKISFLQQCLFTIHNSFDVSDLEHRVMDLLAEPFQLTWFHIAFSPNQANNRIEQNAPLSLYQFPLTQAGAEYGALHFARDLKNPFKREDKDFLDQLCEAISLCIDRMLQIERNNDLQSQWQSTFNAISDPVCLIDENYNIRIANKNLIGKSSESPEGKKCYTVLFGRTDPCLDCHRGQPFRHRDQRDSSKIYDVFSQPIVVDYQKHYFHLYRDVSKQLGLERQLMESAKLAELGTIGSSIAHELNNPLGGMLNFIQLIKLDLKGDETFKQDITEMEKGAQKCKEIVQNLLSFTRDSYLSEKQNISLEEILKRAIMITELRTRALGIPIQLDLPKEKIFIFGRFNQLAQVFCNILQNSYESLLEKRKRFPDFMGLISITASAKDQTLTVHFQDDGIGLAPETKDHVFDPLFTSKDPEKHSGLGLTLAAQILKEHSAHIELSSQKDGKTCVSIRFPRTTPT